MPEITIYANVRDPWSGYDERRAQTFHISVGEAESIISSLQRQIPLEKVKAEKERLDKIS